MKFGFLAHPLHEKEIAMVRTMRYLGSAWGVEAADSLSYRGVLDTCSFRINSGSGVAEGKILHLPIPPENILYDPDTAQKAILEAVDHLAGWGAGVVGLGGYFGIVGDRGADTNRQTPIPVTTGNTLTCYNAIAALELVLREVGIPIAEATIAIVGIPGSIGGLIARYFARKGASLLLVGRSKSPFLEKFHASLPNPGKHRIIDDIHQAVRESFFIITATSTGNIIRQSEILPGRVVIDVAAPRDVIQDREEAGRVLVVDGGRCSSREHVVFQTPAGLPVPFAIENLYGCLCECMLLGLEGKNVPFSIGKTLTEEGLEEIGNMAIKHGFDVSTLYSFGTPVDRIRLRDWSRSFRKLYPGMALSTRKKPQFEGPFDRDTLYQSYEAHVNPCVPALLKMSRMDKLYVRAKGNRVWDSEGKEYLDFVGGYGSVNIGHHHPVVVDAMQRFLAGSIPSFLQIAPQVLTAQLAERLADVMPGDLSVSFFCNSGAEAVEGAIKLCMAATRRSGIISCENSFHGKTLGALSATGRDIYKKPFKQLMPGFLQVAYGDLVSLERALREHEAAAFIVEPIQGEGGVIVPPDGYLPKAIELCHRYGTLVIVDEIQTGFCRTGTFFACEHETCDPDVMTMAKSLSGGLVPIGVYSARREVWQKAYGSPDRYATHTSTFGGNNFAAAAGLAALDVLTQDSFLEEVRTKGAYFRERLVELQMRYPSILKEVRGRGLMLGVEFHPLPEGGLNESFQQVQTYLASTFSQVAQLLPATIFDEGMGFMTQYLDKVEKYLTNQFVLQLGSKLQNEFGILTFITLNNPHVLRVQPPLILTTDDIDYFIQSLGSVIGNLVL